MYRPWTNIMSNPAASKSVASGAEASAISATGDTSHSTSAVAVPVNCNVVLTMAIKRLELREIEGIPMVNRIAVLLDPTKYIDYFDRYGKLGADSLFDGVDLWIVEKWCAWYCDLLESRDCANATIKPADNRICWDPKTKKKKKLTQLWGPEWTRDIDPNNEVLDALGKKGWDNLLKLAHLGLDSRRAATTIALIVRTRLSKGFQHGGPRRTHMQTIDIQEAAVQWQKAEFRSQVYLILKREAVAQGQQRDTQISSADEFGEDEESDEEASDLIQESIRRARIVDTTESDDIEIKMEIEDDTMFQADDTAEALAARFIPSATPATSQEGGQPDYDDGTEGSEDEDHWFDAAETARAMTPPAITGKRKRVSPTSDVNDVLQSIAEADTPLVPTMKLHFESYMVRYQRMGYEKARSAILELLKSLDTGYFQLMGEHLPWPDEPWSRQAQEEVKLRVLAEKHRRHLGEPIQHHVESEVESHEAEPRATSSVAPRDGVINKRPFGRR